MTLRLKPGLRARVDAEAERTGVSLTALIATAVDHYLASRGRQRRMGAEPNPHFDSLAQVLGVELAGRLKPPYVPGVNQPCYCGSGSKYKRCCRPKDQAAGHVR